LTLSDLNFTPGFALGFFLCQCSKAMEAF
jgi:hypothetical protein